MLKYLLRRLLWGILTLFLFMTLVFFVVNLLVAGDWVTQFSLSTTPEQRAEMRAALGLDQPLPQQYVRWLGQFLDGSLGTSYSGLTVADILKRVMPATLMVFVPGTILSFWIGQWLGRVTAWRRGPVSSLTALGSILLYTSFPAWLAFLVVYFLARRLQVVRSLFIPQLSASLWRDAALSTSTVIWYVLASFAGVLALLFLLDRAVRRRWKRALPILVAIPVFLIGSVGLWYLLGIETLAFDVVYLFSLPILTYILLSFGETMLIMRTNMMDTLQEEYILTARAKGVPERWVRDRHAARNALLPVLSRFVISLPYLLTGLVIIEHSLGFSGAPAFLRSGMFTSTEASWHGMGWTFYMALYFQDMPVVLGALVVVGALAIGARLVLDVLHLWLDPRIRYQTRLR